MLPRFLVILASSIALAGCVSTQVTQGQSAQNYATCSRYHPAGTALHAQCHAELNARTQQHNEEAVAASRQRSRQMLAAMMVARAAAPRPTTCTAIRTTPTTVQTFCN